MLLTTPTFESTDYGALWLVIGGFVGLFLVLAVINWLRSRKDGRKR